MEPMAYTWKHKNEDEEHRGFGKHHPGFKDDSGYVVDPLYLATLSSVLEHEMTITDELRGQIAYQLTRRLVIDMPTARACVDDALLGFVHTAPQHTDFKPRISINEEMRLTEAAFEDVPYVAVPVFEGVHHWIDKHLAMDDGRLVGLTVWATTPPRPIDTCLDGRAEPEGYLYRVNGKDGNWLFILGEWPYFWGEQNTTFEARPLYASPAPLPVEPTAKQIDAAIDGFFGDRSFSIADLDHYRRRMRDALIAAACSPAPQPIGSDTCRDWMPIETAPKDGEPVLLEYEGKDGRLYYCVSRWQVNHWRGYFGFNLTRWSRPFPARPKSGSDQ